jgi:hypothetical protein
MKITFTMTPHADQPKHSTRFNFEDLAGEDTIVGVSLVDLQKFKPSFYIPKPVAQRAKRIKVTIEEVA